MYGRMLFVILLGCIWTTNRLVTGLGCLPKICDGNPENTMRPCNPYALCGHYGGKRHNNRLIRGVDLNCLATREIYAPFNGKMLYKRPFHDGDCLDSGVSIEGTGAWQGYIAVISYIRPYRYGGTVKVGDPIGKALNHTCSRNVDSEPHILFELLKQGNVVDPTYHLSNCSCTGQICETNFNNEMKEKPFSYKQGYGKGYDIKCPEPKADSDDLKRPPQIYSPIDGSMLGRFRPHSVERSEISKGYACDNDGVFIKGSGKWQSFTAHIYNAKFMLEPGVKDIRQGQPIATKLVCPGQPFDTVFVEIRYNGRLINMSDLVLATNCKRPDLSSQRD